MRAAFASKNLDLCRSVGNKWAKDRCLREIAEHLKDSSLCEEIEQESWKNLCIVRVGISTGNRKLCNRVSTKRGDYSTWTNYRTITDLKKKCQASAKRREDELKLCEGIKEKEIKKACVSQRSLN